MNKRIAIIGGVSFAVLAGLFAVRAFLSFEVDGPPQKALTDVKEIVPTSHVMTDLRVPLSPLQGFVLNSVGRDNDGREKPILKGDTEQIAWDAIGDLFGDGKKTRPSCTKSDAQKNAENFVRCWDGAPAKQPRRGWAHTKCVTEFGLDGINAARRLVLACVPKALDVALPNRPTKLRYRVYLEGLNLGIKGKVLATEAKIRLDIKPPPNFSDFFVSKKSGFECALRVTGVADLNLALKTVDGQLRLAARAGNVDISPGKSCRPNMPSTLLKNLDDVLLKGVSGLFQGKLQSRIEEALNSPETLGSANDNLSILSQFLSQDFALPLPDFVPVPVSLSVVPRGFSVSDPSQQGANILGMSVGVAAQPVLELKKAPPLVPWKNFSADTQRTLPIKVAQAGNEFVLRPRTSLPLEATSKVVSDVTKKIIADFLPDLRYRDLDVILYQADKRIVMGINVSGVGWLRLNGSVFLTAEPYLSDDGATLRLNDIKFDADTEGFLARRALWVLESGIEKVLEDRLVFDLDRPIAQAWKGLKDLKIPLKAGDQDIGSLNIALEDFSLDRAWIDADTLNIAVVATGRAQVDLLNN